MKHGWKACLSAPYQRPDTRRRAAPTLLLLYVVRTPSDCQDQLSHTIESRIYEGDER